MSEKILVMGSLGSIGRRYCAILKYLGVRYVGIDIQKQPWDYDKLTDCTRALVCTPTQTHFNICRGLNIPWLCEKPLSKNPKEIEDLMVVCERKKITGHMVDNWRYTANLPLAAGRNDVSYNNFHTGSDGYNWDLIQLHYLAKRAAAKLPTPKPYFEAKINGSKVRYKALEKSYIRMIETWLSSPKLLWSLQNALEATQKVIKIEKGIVV